MGCRLVKIDIPARIHIGLISLSDNATRRNGGLGFSIADFGTKMTVEAAASTEVIDLRDSPLSVDEREKIRRLICTALEKVASGAAAKIVIEQDSIAPHIGLGSGTATILGGIESAALVNGVSLDRAALLALSGRGGASGVGVNTYFDGGYVFDLGHRRGNGSFTSSDFSFCNEQPVVGWKGALPDWEIGLCIPDIPAPSLDDERRLFEEICPIPMSESALAAYYALFGVHASVIERDYSGFAQAVEEMQKLTWKGAEWALHGDELRQVCAIIRSSGAHAVGMSSLGPSLYFMSDNIAATMRRAESLLPRASLAAVYPSRLGRVISD